MVDRKEYNREYYLRNRERLLARRKEYYRENDEKIKAWNREYNKGRVEERRETQRLWREKNADKLKQYREEHRAERAAYAREYRESVKDRYKEAHHAVSNAIKLGKMEKKPCEICGNNNSQAHHDDYNKPLEVRWLCRSCHLAWHQEHTPVYGKEENGRG